MVCNKAIGDKNALDLIEETKPTALGMALLRELGVEDATTATTKRRPSKKPQ